MNIALAIFTSLPVDDSLNNWSADWVWGVPLIVLTVVIHVIGLGVINWRVDRVIDGTIVRRYPYSAFVTVLGVTTLLATMMHAIEAVIWAVAHRLLDAIRDYKSAMLYSLNAMTSYGHENLALAGHWKLMGAIEALNGSIPFSVHPWDPSGWRRVRADSMPGQPPGSAPKRRRPNSTDRQD